MSTLNAAISWSGTDVMLSLFVIWSAGERGEVSAPSAVSQPRSSRTYQLEDVDDILRGKRISETDLRFDAVPPDLDRLLEVWLTTAIRAGGAVAWFGFEGSFSFEHLLTPDVAELVYGVAGPNFVALATNDHVRASRSWLSQLAAARLTLQ